VKLIMNKADRKASLARARAGARGKIPMLVGEPSDVPGFQAWMVGEVMVASDSDGWRRPSADAREVAGVGDFCGRGGERPLP
jgi:hypothetical protein